VLILATASIWLAIPLRLAAWQTSRSRGGAPTAIQVHAGELVLATVEQREVDVMVSVRAPDASSAGVFDSFEFGDEPVAFVAAQAGEYVLSIRHADGRPIGMPPAVVERLHRDRVYPDSGWVTAARRATEAKRLAMDPTASNLNAALRGNREALLLWQELGEYSSAARTLIKIADILYAQSACVDAGAHYEKALGLALDLNDRRITAEGRNNASMCLMQLGEEDAAVSLLRQAMDDWHALRLPFGESVVAANLGLLSWRAGSFEEALSYHQRALAGFLRLHKRREAALARNNLGLTYSSLNKPSLALTQLQWARAEFHALGDRAAEGQALLNIGYLELLSKQTAKAIRSQRQAVALLRDGPDLRAKADAMTNLGSALAGTKREESLGLLREALALYEGIGDRRGQASALHHLGRVNAAGGALALGLQELDSAFRIRSAVGIRDAAAESLFESARILEAQGRLDEAAEQMSRVIEMTEMLRATAGGDGFRTSFFSSKQAYFERYVALLIRMRRPAEALAVAERARGRTLLDILSSARRGIPLAANASLVARKDQVERRLNYLSQQLLSLSRTKPDSAREAALHRDIDELFAQREVVEYEIRKTGPKSADLWNPRPAPLAELQSLLDANTELLEFALGETESYLWVVTDSSLRVFTLPRRADLEATARKVVKLGAAFRLRQRDPALEREFNGALLRMGRQLFAGVGNNLDRKRWVVVPDGVLHYLPFAAVRLWAPAGTGLKSETEMVVLPSASTLAMLRRNQPQRQRAHGTIAIFADPVFDPLDPRVANNGVVANQPGPASGRPLARLPYSKLEAVAVAALAPPESTLVALDFAANKSRLVSEAGRYRIVHISTHASLDDVHPELSSIALSQVDRWGRPVDGFLRLYEVYNLSLAAVDLVVLSACDSGTGQYVRGEGLVGFVHGFFHAGAGAVLATLWSIEDQASKELIRLFYEALLVSRLKPAAALAAAQKRMRADSRWNDPYYWAGFVLIAAPE